MSAIVLAGVAGPLGPDKAAEAASRRPSASSATAASAPAAAGSPNQGMYDSCAPIPGATWGTGNVPCNANADLDMMAQAGFKLVLNYDLFVGDINQINDYLNHAASVGMKVIIPLHDPEWWTGNALDVYSDLASTCNCSTNAQFAAYVVGALKNHPATWGYYLGDEVSSQLSAAQAHWARVKAADPLKPTFIVSAEDEGTLGQAMIAVGNSPALSILAPDIYPIGREKDPAADPLSSVGATVANVHAFAATLGKQTGAVLQSYNWKKSYPEEQWLAVARFPTRTEMRKMRDDAIANGANAFILWYSFFDLMTDTPWQQHWADLRWAAFGT